MAQTGGKNPYEMAIDELEQGRMQEGLWAKARLASGSDEKKACAKYVRLRVAELGEHLEVQPVDFTPATQKEQLAQYISALEALRKTVGPDVPDLPSEPFDGPPSGLESPLSVDEIVIRSNLLEHQIVDLIKLRKLRGVRHDGEWYVDLAGLA